MVKIHSTSDVQSESIGENTQIWQFCVILKNAVIGNNCNINCNVLIENNVVIGNNVTIKPGVQIWDGISLEDNTFIGPNVTFTNDLVPRSKHDGYVNKKTFVNKGASIGANSTILAGNTIGSYSLVGAGSVVTKDVKDYHVVYGNPARHTGYITEEGILVSLDLLDKSGGVYEYKNGRLLQLT